VKHRLLIPLVCLVTAGVPAVVSLPASAAPRSPVSARTVGPAGPAMTRRAPHLTSAELGRLAHVTPSVAELTPRLPKLDSTLSAVAGVAGAKFAANSVRPDRRGQVSVIVEGSAVGPAAAAVGARIQASFPGRSVVSVPAARLQALAAQPGVTAVHASSPAIADATSGAVSQGVTLSQADAWQAAGASLGNGGQGVDVAVIDEGFGNLDAEIAAHHFDGTDGVSRVVYSTSPSGPGTPDQCDNTSPQSDHGTGVAEIVHQMAPNATIHLYCVTDSGKFADAARQIVATHTIKIASSSLEFFESPADPSRGDGYSGIAALAVKMARENGVLWIQAAGNSAQDHWSGTLSDHYGYDSNSNAVAGQDDLADLDVYRDSSGLQLTEFETAYVEAGDTATVSLTWDQWPTSSNNTLLLAVEQFIPYDSTNPSCQGVAATQKYCEDGPATVALHRAGDPPILVLDVPNTTTDARLLAVSIQSGVFTGTLQTWSPRPFPALHYDLTMHGVGPDYLSSIDAAHAGHAAAGSIANPADSPWAMAVGAVDVGNQGLEAFSSRGPTIDNRTKPDILGYDGVATNLTDLESPGTSGFYGTSAAAPHVAGAAALVAAANPSLDPSQIEAFLESPANGAGQISPPTNNLGHGVLKLGTADSTAVTAANGSRYHLFDQAQRIADTRSGLGVPKASLHAGTEVTVPVPTSGPDAVPSTATSVVVSVSGTAARGGTYLSIYPHSWPGNSTLNLAASDPNASVTSIVRLYTDPNTGQQSFKLRNAAAQTDAIITLLGYFGAASETGAGLGYVGLTPARVLDTRYGIGVQKHKLVPNQAVTVDTTTAGVPTSASVVAVTIQALNQTAGGQLTAFPHASPPVSSLDYTRYARANLVLVPVVNGTFTLQNRYATTDALVDVSGYFSPSATARFVTLDNPIRIVDTRTGNGGRDAAMTTNSTVTVDGAGMYGVPYNATALWVNLTAVAVTDGWASVYPAGQGFPHASTVNYTTMRSVPDSAIATLSAGSAGQPPALSAVVRAGTTQLLLDNYGYFYTPGN